MICRGIKSSVSHCTFLFGGKYMSKIYDKQVKEVLKEVERILTDDAARSHGVKILIQMGIDEVSYISYSIREMVVK